MYADFRDTTSPPLARFAWVSALVMNFTNSQAASFFFELLLIEMVCP